MVTSSALPPHWLEKIRSSIVQRTGLAPQTWVLEARIRERMEATGIQKLERYAQAMTARPELTALVELLRVGETRFFRHESHMRALTELVLPALRKGQGTTHVWSAGCATGEEAYTLAMLLARGLEGRRKVDILASDISPESLQKARTGVYRQAAFDAVPSAYRHGITRMNDGKYQVVPRLRDLVSFEERNLAQGTYPANFDLIFCRNVLIYFEKESKDLVLRRLVSALKPGAFLFLGYSESLRDVPELEVIRSGECSVYRKRVGKDANVPPDRRPATHPPVPRPHSVRLPATQNNSHPPSGRHRLQLRGEYQDRKRLEQEIEAALRSNARFIEIDLDGADFLSDDAAESLREARGRSRSMGVSLSWTAKREGHLRFLRRHNLNCSEDHA